MKFRPGSDLFTCIFGLGEAHVLGPVLISGLNSTRKYNYKTFFVIRLNLNMLRLHSYGYFWFQVPPPPMEPDHPYYEQIVKDPRYAEGPSPDEFPKYESLKLTIARTLPFWDSTIVPEIKAGKCILIAAHGNSLRGIVKHLDSIYFWVFARLEVFDW